MSITRSFLLVALLGFLDALYLFSVKLFGGELFCGGFAGCATVAQSPYSIMFGAPLSLWGLLFYGASLVVAMGLFSAYAREARHVALPVATVGAGFSLYFLYVQGALIGAFCIYCVFSALCSFVLCALAVLLLRKQRMDVPLIERSR